MTNHIYAPWTPEQEMQAIRWRKRDLAALEDGIGDVIVCLVNVAYMSGIDIEDAFAKVTDEVTARRGRMVAGGAFVKDAK